MSNRAGALESIMVDLGVNENKAKRILREREYDVQLILVLWHYIEWARDNKFLRGGPVLDTVKYQLIEGIIELKPYSNEPFKVGVWDLLDLTNKRLFRRFSYSTDLLIDCSLEDVLFLKPSEFSMLKTAKKALTKLRKT